MQWLKRVGIPWFTASASVVALSLVSQTAGIALLASLCGWWLLSHILLPRLGHRAFKGGRYSVATWNYRIVAKLRPSALTRQRVSLSLLACETMARRFAEAEARVQILCSQDLDEESEAILLNNRAYLCARKVTNLDVALTFIDRALKLRPGVPGFLHTKGALLLARGEADRALPWLERVAAAEEGRTRVSRALQAESNHDLGVAWLKLGHPDYGRFYDSRAYDVLPESGWGAAAQARLRGDEKKVS